MDKAIFLSASIPTPDSGEYYKTADPLLIQSAVRALADVLLGRRRIVWGGHPTITPMIMEACVQLDVDYSDSVKLYQSLAFDDEFPEENKHFNNIVFTPKVDGDDRASLQLMRQEMLAHPSLEAAVFIGGMAGVEVESSLFESLHPSAKQIFVGSTGGAAQIMARKNGATAEYLENIDYFGLFHKELNIAVNEPRLTTTTTRKKQPRP